MPPSGPMTAHCFRLHPGDKLMPSLKQAASIILARSGCEAAFIVTAVGSLQDATIRLANASRIDGNGDDTSGGNDIKTYNQRFEVVSLVGTFSSDGCHVHVALSDALGNTVGGHLIDGTIFTTCEIVLGTVEGVKFARTMDDSTGYNELEVTQLPKRQSLIRHAIPAALLLLSAGFVARRLKAR